MQAPFSPFLGSLGRGVDSLPALLVLHELAGERDSALGSEIFDLAHVLVRECSGQAEAAQAETFHAPRCLLLRTVLQPPRCAWAIAAIWVDESRKAAAVVSTLAAAPGPVLGLVASSLVPQTAAGPT